MNQKIFNVEILIKDAAKRNKFFKKIITKYYLCIKLIQFIILKLLSAAFIITK